MPRASLIAVAALLFAGSTAAAPDETQTQSTAEPKGKSGAAEPDPSTLSPQEMLDRGQKELEEIGKIINQIQALANKAFKEKDLVKYNCINEKLNQAEVHSNDAQTALSNLQDAIDSKDDESRLYEFQRLGILFQKVQLLNTEVQSCIGKDLSFVGPTKVDSDVDPSIPKKDPTQPPVPPPPYERPPGATIF